MLVTEALAQLDTAVEVCQAFLGVLFVADMVAFLDLGIIAAANYMAYRAQDAAFILIVCSPTAESTHTAWSWVTAQARATAGRPVI